MVFYRYLQIRIIHYIIQINISACFNRYKYKGVGKLSEIPVVTTTLINHSVN